MGSDSICRKFHQRKPRRQRPTGSGIPGGRFLFADGGRMSPTNRFGYRIGTAAAKISEALVETPRTVNEVYTRSKTPGVRGVLEGLVKKGLAKKARIDGRVRYWLP